MKIEGNLVDIHCREIFPATIEIGGGKIRSIYRNRKRYNVFIIPGLIDSHIHIESSMVTPGSFAVSAVSRGTTGVVADPHEIANVLGIEGVEFMINDAKKVPLKFWFGAPSCVPATAYESSGSVIGADAIRILLAKDEIKFLAEMMNFPGVIFDDPVVLEKISIARENGKKIDGHAPGVTGDQLKKYISAGISTDHECITFDEAKEKISLGMKILIREGSAARNLDALKELIRTDPDMVMLCSDDLHPEMLVNRHINKPVATLISDGYDIFDVLRSCTLNPVLHYGLDAGLLRPGDRADITVVNDLREMDVIETWIEGIKVFDRGKTLFTYEGSRAVNKFHSSGVNISQITVHCKGAGLKVIEAFDGELITKQIMTDTGNKKYIISDTDRDILKIVVKDRYNDGLPATAFIKGFGLKSGAFASSVAHDSHNIICIGTSDEEIAGAINEVIKMKGGLAVVSEGESLTLELPVGGIMSGEPVEIVAGKYLQLTEKVKSLGCKMSAPFMTLSFMALLVIPELKLSDKGLFDSRTFSLVPLFER